MNHYAELAYGEFLSAEQLKQTAASVAAAKSQFFPGL
jgi:hypothetical protein